MDVQSNVSDLNEMSYENVSAGVREIVGQQMGIGAETVREDHSLENDLGCDSLDRVEIMMEVEDQFDLDIPDDSVDAVHTVGDIVAGVMRLLGKPSPG